MPKQTREYSDDEAVLDPLFAVLGKLYAQKEENRKKYAKGGRPNDPCPTSAKARLTICSAVHDKPKFTRPLAIAGNFFAQNARRKHNRRSLFMKRLF